MSSDEKMIRGCLEGRRQAQNQLYHRYAPTMLGVCMRYARSREEAEDLMQEGFIKVFQHIPNYKGTGSFEGWIRRIMVNTAINHYHASLKQQLVHVENIEILQHNWEQEHAEVFDLTTVTAPVDPAVVMGLIQRMPDGYRMILNMYVFEGYQHKDIASMLGISENTSKSQLSKGRKFLRQKLAVMSLKETKIYSSNEE